MFRVMLVYILHNLYCLLCKILCYAIFARRNYLTKEMKILATNSVFLGIHYE
jgi:hypothetical protein